MRARLPENVRTVYSARRAANKPLANAQAVDMQVASESWPSLPQAPPRYGSANCPSLNRVSRRALARIHPRLQPAWPGQIPHTMKPSLSLNDDTQTGSTCKVVERMFDKLAATRSAVISCRIVARSCGAFAAEYKAWIRKPVW